eukprot:9469354-Pyramimonas_sp.AAC.1
MCASGACRPFLRGAVLGTMLHEPSSMAIALQICHCSQITPPRTISINIVLYVACGVAQWANMAC